MKQTNTIMASILKGAVIFWLIGIPGQQVVRAAEATEVAVQVPESGARQWSGGAAMGFLGNTPDGTAFAVNLNADRFVSRNVALGPLLQLGFTDNLNQIGFSGQAKSWVDIPDTDDRLKLVLQAGVGFVHADIGRDDTSWLIPIGVGVDFAMTRTVSFTSTFLLNFTDLDTGPGSHTNVMPGLTFGVQF